MIAGTEELLRNGKIVTFYSYKGGTGRSMALANVAWILANGGNRVLTIDWDLEAPGLHRYFEPYLEDPRLESSTGLMDFLMGFATAAVSGQSKAGDPDWYAPYSNLLAHAVSIQWEFPNEGTLDFVAAGRQDAVYANRVNSFHWQNFYEILGGGVFLESVKRSLRGLYDYILIDSRTGVSDTSGICTVQMPDELVVCFTLNRQSIYGAAAAARSALAQRVSASGAVTLKVWPVPTRIESSEKDRLEIAHTIARTTFSGLMHHLNPVEIDEHWGDISVAYEPYYAYEEVLAIFRDRPRNTGSMLAKMQLIAQRLCGTRPIVLASMDESRRVEGLAAFTSRSAWDFIDELKMLAVEYERTRRSMPAGSTRTEQMNLLVGRVQILSGQRDAGQVAEHVFNKNTDGCRVVGLALAKQEPQRRHINIALDAVSRSRSPFEQYHALRLILALLSGIEPAAAQQVRAVLREEIGKSITEGDSTRWVPAHQILDRIGQSPTGPIKSRASETTTSLGQQTPTFVECKNSSSFVRYEDVEENHGPNVATRGVHQLQLPPAFHIAKHPVTNRLYMEFVKAGGYENDAFWVMPYSSRGSFLTGDGQTKGPATWQGATWPDGKAEHPVSGISFLEAQAFIRWCNSQDNRTWALPPEDLWEFAARGEVGLIYPWGDAFDATKCNFAGSGLDATSEVTTFESGASAFGCCDMAGNVWEFVLASDAGPDWCVLRGGGYKNTSTEVRSYLRLIRVPQWHRPPDFGFRLIQGALDASIRLG